MQEREKRHEREAGHLYLLTGLIIGVLIGVLLSMMLPVHYTDTDPSLLQNADKDLYRSLIARAYLVEVDHNRARARLELLGDVNPQDALVAQAQQLLASGGSEEESRALALLASAINEGVVQITALPDLNDRPVSPPLETVADNLPEVELTKDPAAEDQPYTSGNGNPAPHHYTAANGRLALRTGGTK